MILPTAGYLFRKVSFAVTLFYVSQKNVTNGLHVNEKVIAKALRENLPFIATENIIMEAVKRGGDRQAVHEIIRRCSMEATAKMKDGEDCDLVERLLKEPELGLDRETFDALLDPALYIGRCPEQVEKYVESIRPLLKDIMSGSEEINI